jgi:hypothetical protein
MMLTTNFFIPTEPFHFSKGKVEQKRRPGRQGLIVQIRSKTQPENRLWKLSLEASSLKSRNLELTVFLFFGLVATAAAVYCGTELFQVVKSGALEQTVQALLAR